LVSWRKFKYNKKFTWGYWNSNSNFSFGGDTPPNTGATELYDGTSWTTSPASLNTARQTLAGAGTQTSAGLAFGGATPSATAATEEWTGPSPATKTITVS
jgi:hypothetical protein